MALVFLKRSRCALAVLALLFLGVPTAQAGMAWFPPRDWARPRLITELTRQRLEAISFFVFGFLICGALIQWIWNSARKDFPRLPRLGYFKALGVVTLWGLLFVLVMTMIAGARELMTPGAWKKQGATYRLAEPGPLKAIAPFDAQRFARLQTLGDALGAYADQHEGRYPLKASDPAIPADYWIVSRDSDARFVYVGGRKTTAEEQARPVVYEPAPVDDLQLVLMSDGSIETRSNEGSLPERRSTSP